jgi:hypothetical protein
MAAQQKDDRSAWRQISRYMEIGLMFPASTVAGLLIEDLCHVRRPRYNRSRQRLSQ